MKKVFTLLLLLSTIFTVKSQTGTNIVISQVYGAGGNTGSVYTNDFVELFNPTGSAININNWSIQYNSSASTTTTWKKTLLPNVSILPGQYYLVEESQGTMGTTPLPTPDFIGNIAMSGTAGKLVLVSDTNDIAIACPVAADIIDKVGYGTASACFEGTGPTPPFPTGNISSVFRANSGCTDTNNNAADFTAGPAAPRNTATAIHLCGSVGPTPSLVAGTLVDFGSVNVGANSASQNFNLSGTNLTGAPGNITITAPSANFQVSNNNSSWGSSATIPYTSATLASTPVYVRFTPQSGGVQNGNISINGGGVATAVNVAVSGTGVAAPTPTLTASALTGFGNVCVNVTSGSNSFTVTGSNLTTADIIIGPLAGYTFSTTAAGTYTASLDLAQPGGAYSQTVFVKLTPTTIQSYNGNIPVTGGGAPSVNVAATGAGANSAPAVTTGTTTNITPFSATLAGTITGNGCTAVTAYGIEYSTVNGFVGGTGTMVSSSNISSGMFTSTVTGLNPSTSYYYRAYATNGGGISYGGLQAFRTSFCAPPVDSSGKASAITTHSAIVSGAVTDTGCTAVTVYGIEYSGIRDFANGDGIKVFGSNLAGKDFSANLENLVQGVKYYYKAFATNQSGTSYGQLDSFMTAHIPPGLMVYANPAVQGRTLYFTIDSLPNGYYAAQLLSSSGQLVYQKNMTIHVGFIDDSFIVPVNIAKGVYILKVLNTTGYATQTSIVIL